MRQASRIRIDRLTQSHQAEVLSFLSERPVDNVVMSGYIRDNGIMSPLNRGRFYACRNPKGTLEGVALIGHGMSFDSRSQAATETFAQLTRKCSSSFMLMGEHQQVQSFWSHYARDGAEPRLLRNVSLLEQRHPFAGCQEIEGLRAATPAQIEQVVALHAEMVLEETGRDPLETEAEAFRQRCLRRIERQRTWVWVKDGRVIFKADIIAQTPEVFYVEGIYVCSGERRKGYGRRCLAQLGRQLLERTEALCLFADNENAQAHSFYRSVGYTFLSRYDILYF